MTLDEMRAFLQLAESQGVAGHTHLFVVINGRPGTFEINASNVHSSITGTPTLGIRSVQITPAEIDA